MSQEILDIEDRLIWVTEALQEYIILCSTGENRCYILRYFADDLRKISEELDSVRKNQ